MSPPSSLRGLGRGRPSPSGGGVLLPGRASRLPERGKRRERGRARLSRLERPPSGGRRERAPRGEGSGGVCPWRGLRAPSGQPRAPGGRVFFQNSGVGGRQRGLLLCVAGLRAPFSRGSRWLSLGPSHPLSPGQVPLRVALSRTADATTAPLGGRASVALKHYAGPGPRGSAPLCSATEGHWVAPGASHTRSPRIGLPSWRPKPEQLEVLTGSIFSILLIAIILLAVCVYKPIRRR